MHAKAEQMYTTDNCYEIIVPANVTLSNNSGKLESNLEVSANIHERKWIQIDVTSDNNYSLVGEETNNKVPYKLSETKFVLNPQYPLNNDDAEFKQSITITTDEKPAYADDYKDTLNFCVTNIWDTRTIALDCNGGNVNGQTEVIYTVRDGSSYGKLPVPSKTNADFLGWKDEKNNTIYSGSTVMPSTEKLTAVYEETYVLGIGITLNGVPPGFMINMFSYDLYINGNIAASSTIINNAKMKDGDSFKLTNFKVVSGYYYAGLWSEEDTSKFTYEYDDTGKVISVSGTINKKTWPAYSTGQIVSIIFNIKADSDFSRLYDKTPFRKIMFDADKPEDDKNAIAVLTSFKSEANAYMEDTTLHVYNPDGGNVVAGESLKNMFSGIPIIEADISNLDVTNVTTTLNMFRACSKLKQINVEGLNFENLEDFSSMFCYCSSLQKLDLNSWNTPKLQKMVLFVNACSNLTELDINDLDVSHVTTFNGTFEACHQLQTLDLSKWDASSATDMGAMFWYSVNLSIDLSNFDVSNVRNMAYMLGYIRECKGLENWDTHRLVTADQMFNCNRSGSLNLTSFDTSNVISMTYTFANLSNVEELDLSSFDTHKLVDTRNMFNNSKKLKTVYVSDDFVNNIRTSSNMFLGCDSLVGGMNTAYDPTFFDGTATRIDGCPNAPGYFTDIADKPNGVATQALVVDDDPVVVEDNSPQIEEYEPSEEDLSYSSEDNIPPADTLPSWQEEYSE